VIDRRSALWLGGLAAVAVSAGTFAVLMAWWSADLTTQADAFYFGLGGDEQISEEVHLYWGKVFENVQTLQTLVAPLLIGALTAVFAILAVLARLWQLRQRRDQALADQATAAS